MKTQTDKNEDFTSGRGAFKKDGASPKLSVIIPSYNQGDYIEETIRSVVEQQYPNLELIIIDGGSTDNSVDIIQKYESHISYWVSEKDKGQADAINKGLQKATGEWIGWLNSDDCYMPGALTYVFNEIELDKYDLLFGNCYVGSSVQNAEEHRQEPEKKRTVKDILKFFFDAAAIIPSQSIFVRKAVVDEVGLMDISLHYCMDLDWFVRIFLNTDRRLFYQKTICFYRINDTTKTSNNFYAMAREAWAIALKYAERLNQDDRKEITNLVNYSKMLLNYKSEGSKSVFGLLKIALKYPGISSSDVRFKIMLKQSILGNGK